MSHWTLLGWVCAVLALLVVVRQILTRVTMLRATALAPSASRILSRLVKPVDYMGDAFFCADGAPTRLVAQRKLGLKRLADGLRARYSVSADWGDAIRDSFSDLRFADANRVPFPFSRFMRQTFNLCSVVTASDGPHLKTLDGHRLLDVSGSYGVNVAGYDRYKEWMQKGLESVKDLGPVLGPLHPIIAENIDILKSISKLDEVSFHMSGTEAVMAAARLARFNTGRKLIVCFSGAYHGWWDGVQPGLGSERAIGDCIVLKDTDQRSLKAIRKRAHEIAGILVNPVQSFHPNSPPPNDAVLLMSGVRQTKDPRAAYGDWLQQLRAVCDEVGIPLIFDEVYTGFRLAPGGAQEYFGVQADLVVYGKTVGGGMPIGVVCGTKKLMRRFDPSRPMRFAFIVGTFAGHPVVMGAMNQFLKWVTTAEADDIYKNSEKLCNSWVEETNKKLVARNLPVRVVNFGTVWTVLFKEPSRYNWLLQYYLRQEGLNLSFVGTGRCLASLDYTPADFDELGQKLLAATDKMHHDSWWVSAAEAPQRDKAMKKQLVREILGSLIQVKQPIQRFYAEVMQRKQDDHYASHSHVVNQILHVLSSTVFIICYFLIFSDLTVAMVAGLAALFVRQFGHAVIEPVSHGKEELLLGFNTRSKTVVVAAYMLFPAVHLWQADALTWATVSPILEQVAKEWFALTVFVVFGHVLRLIPKYGLRLSMVWFVKLVTDPISDLAFYPRQILSFQGGRRAHSNDDKALS